MGFSTKWYIHPKDWIYCSEWHWDGQSGGMVVENTLENQMPTEKQVIYVVCSGE